MHRATLRFIAAIGALLAIVFGAIPAYAGGSLVIRNARLLPMVDGQPEVIEAGVLVVRDGVIEAIGDASTPIPSDLPVVDVRGATVMPGMVLADSGLAGNHAGDESISGLYHAADAFDRFRDYRALLEAGITAVHLNPGTHRFVSGAGAVVRVSGHWNDRILDAASDVTVNLSPAARNPPDALDPLKKPSADNLIIPAQPQRPSSRMEQWPALRDALDLSEESSASTHLLALRRLWNAGLPMRVQVSDHIDASDAIGLLDRAERRGYLVGSFDLDTVSSMIAASSTPLVYGLSMPLQSSAPELGQSERQTDLDLSRLATLPPDSVAFALARGPITDLRLAAATSLRSGLDRGFVLRALTSNPARILGVSDRIGSLAPGLLADFVVYSDDPLAATASVQRVYMNGRLAFRATDGGSVVVRAGTIWIAPGETVRDGEVLITDGVITEVGSRVARPKGTLLIDAGPEGFVTPGFVDGFGHLGLGGDRGATGTNIDLTDLVGVPGAPESRVAQAGVTSMMVGPYSIGRTGSRMSAIKTWGEGREDRVVRSSAAVMLDVRGSDPTTIERQIEQRLGPAKQYDERWKKYEKDLDDWEKAQAEGRVKKPAQPQVVQDQQAQQQETDPITGTWSMRAESEVLPEPIEGEIALKLNGNDFEGRATSPEAAAVEHRIVGTVDGNTVTGRVEIDTGGFGTPTFTGTLGDGTMEGTITLGPITATFSGERTSTEEVQFRVTRRRATGEDGRPKPPPIDEALEPYRSVFAGETPLVVGASTPFEIDRVVDTVTEKHKLRLVILGGEFADTRSEKLASSEVGVLLPAAESVRRGNEVLHMPTVLSNAGVVVGFYSDAEDGARNLGLNALYAVQQGMSPEAAMEALTLGPARMFGLADRIGSIRPGMDGDLVIFDGYPLDAATSVRRVLINGEEVQQ